MLEMNATFWTGYIAGSISGTVTVIMVAIWLAFYLRTNKPEPNQSWFSDQAKAMIAKTERMGEEMLKSFTPDSVRKERIEDLILEIEMNGQLIKRMYDELKRT
jgi:hypothetical protein